MKPGASLAYFSPTRHNTINGFIPFQAIMCHNQVMDSSANKLRLHSRMNLQTQSAQAVFRLATDSIHKMTAN